LLRGAADESRRSSSAGAAPTSSTLPNPNQNNTPRPHVTVFGSIAIAAILLIGAVGLLWGRSTQSVAPVAASSTAPQNESVEVDVIVTPANASVEIDGRLVEIGKGIVKIKGIVGTMRRVRAFVGAYETRAEVVISLEGAIPARIHVAVPAPTPSASAPAPAPLAPTPTAPKNPKTQSIVAPLRDNR
jgi:hypothetical protein